VGNFFYTLTLYIIVQNFVVHMHGEITVSTMWNFTDVSYHAKFHQNRPSSCGDMVIFWFSRWRIFKISNF